MLSRVSGMCVLATVVIGASSTSFADSEACQLVQAILDDDLGDVPPLGTRKCVLDNGVRDGSVVVDVAVMRRQGKRKVRSELFRPGEECGKGIVPIFLREIPEEPKRVIHVVKIELFPHGRGKYKFSIWLQPLDTTDLLEKRGSIGVDCGGTDNDGVVTRRGSRWRVVKVAGATKAGTRGTKN